MGTLPSVTQRLAIAYLRQFYVTKEPANLDLAGRNAANALRYNPQSAMGLLSQALGSWFAREKRKMGQAYFEKANHADPGNPEILFEKAWALARQGLLPEAEQTYRDIIGARPNFWPAYNNLGVILTREAQVPRGGQGL